VIVSAGRAGRSSVSFSIHTGADALASHTACAAFARELGAGERAAHEIEIAAAELATNLLRHGGGGTLVARAIAEPEPGIELVARDEGPGFSDIESARRDGFSQGRDLVTEVPPTARSGLGAGLGAVERLMDELRIENREGGGATVTATKRLR